MDTNTTPAADDAAKTAVETETPVAADAAKEATEPKAA